MTTPAVSNIDAPHMGAQSPRALKLLTKGWSLLEATEGRKLDQRTYAAYLGRPDTTLFSWIVRERELLQIEALLLLLERLPRALWTELLAPLLREYPSLDSPRIAHDPVVVSQLRGVLREIKGLTLVHSEQDFLRTYVFNALGHAATRVGTSQRAVCGLDGHSADALVPVPGISYLGNGLPPQEVLAKLRSQWNQLQEGPFAFFNSIWSQMPAAEQGRIIALASRRHVILADGFALPDLRPKLISLTEPIRLVIATALNNSEIRIEFSALQPHRPKTRNSQTRTGMSKNETK